MSTTYAYEQYFGLKEHPFSITPDPRFVYLSDSHRTALERLNHGAAGGSDGFVLLTGDVGTGKTTICRTFLERLPPKTEVVLILNPILTLNEFLQTICNELDLVIDGDRGSNKNLTDHLNKFLLQVYAVGHKTILIVDEAQNLTQELMEQIRLLTNLETDTDKLLQIFLIGQPELRDMLDRPELLQVSQRITSRFHLGPLNKRETGEYVDWRLKVAGADENPFTPGAVRQIFAFSKGVPRLINVLCDKALHSAYQRSSQKIDGTIMKDAKQHVVGQTQASASAVSRATMLVGAVCLLAAASIGLMYSFNLSKLQPEVDTRIADVREPAAVNTLRDAVPIQRGPADLRPAPAAPSYPAPTEAATWGASEAAVSAGNAGPPTTRIKSAQAPPAAPGIAVQSPATATTEPMAATVARNAAPPAQRPRHSSTPRAPNAAGAAAASGPEVQPRSQTAPTASSAAIPADQTLDDYTRRYAERKLLSMWGVEGAEPSSLNFCQDAAAQGLTCLSDRSALSGLYRYDRPAILYLRIGEVSSYAVALKASPESVVLDVLGQEHVIPAASLDDVWDGKFLLLWRRPGNIRGNISQGVSGRPALWLRRALDQIEGKSTVGSTFDTQLASRLKAFQRRSGLAADGIVGPRTYILLQNKLAADSG